MWTDDDAPAAGPQFGAGGRAWFRAWSLSRKGVTALPPDLRGRVVDLLTARAESLVSWIPADVYRGPGFSNGEWQVNAIAWTAALNDCQKIATTERFPTLDAWLQADAAGTLAHKGATGGQAQLPRALRDTLIVAAWGRRKAWPKRCRSCGESFSPDRRNAKNCPTCRAQSRAVKGAKGVKEANTAPIGATESPSVPSVPRATKVEKRGTTGTNAAPLPPMAAGVIAGYTDAMAAMTAQLEANMKEIRRRLGDNPS